MPALRLDPVQPRIRALFERETVVDSDRARLLYERDRLPVYHFPTADVRTELLEPDGHEERTELKGILRHHALRVGDRTVAEAAWTYAEPPPEAPWLDGLVAFRWNAVDDWFAEAERLFAHPRDPYKRIDVCRSTRHVRVSLDGHLLAESRRASALYETGLPPRWYLPAEDVRTELLVPSPKLTLC